jgi:hypothetical protein
MTEGPSVEPGSRPGLLQRLLPPVSLVGDDGAVKPSRMTPREQLVAAGLGLANVAITVGMASSVTDQQAFVLLAGLLASVVTVVGARVGNRILALVGLFGCTLARPSSAAIFLAIVLPYYGAAMWIFLKYNRVVKEQGNLRRQQRAEERKAGGGPPTRKGKAPPKGGAKKTPAKLAPPKSKRYTPPKARRKPPPPPPKPPRDRSIVD